MNVTLLAFAAERRAVAPLGDRRPPLSINISRPTGPQQQTRRTLWLRRRIGQTDRSGQTDDVDDAEHETGKRSDRDVTAIHVARRSGVTAVQQLVARHIGLHAPPGRGG